jgi:hypothetical protein
VFYFIRDTGSNQEWLLNLGLETAMIIGNPVAFDLIWKEELCKPLTNDLIYNYLDLCFDENVYKSYTRISPRPGRQRLDKKPDSIMYYFNRLLTDDQKRIDVNCLDKQGCNILLHIAHLPEPRIRHLTHRPNLLLEKIFWTLFFDHPTSYDFDAVHPMTGLNFYQYVLDRKIDGTITGREIPPRMKRILLNRKACRTQIFHEVFQYTLPIEIITYIIEPYCSSEHYSLSSSLATILNK